MRSNARGWITFWDLTDAPPCPWCFALAVDWSDCAGWPPDCAGCPLDCFGGATDDEEASAVTAGAVCGVEIVAASGAGTSSAVVVFFEDVDGAEDGAWAGATIFGADSDAVATA